MSQLHILNVVSQLSVNDYHQKASLTHKIDNLDQTASAHCPLHEWLEFGQANENRLYACEPWLSLI